MNIAAESRGEDRALDQLSTICRCYQVVAELLRAAPTEDTIAELRAMAGRSTDAAAFAPLADFRRALGRVDLSAVREDYRRLEDHSALECMSPDAASVRWACVAADILPGGTRACELRVVALLHERAGWTIKLSRPGLYDAIMERRNELLTRHVVGCLRPMLAELEKCETELFRSAGQALQSALNVDVRLATPRPGVRKCTPIHGAGPTLEAALPH